MNMSKHNTTCPTHKRVEIYPNSPLKTYGKLSSHRVHNQIWQEKEVCSPTYAHGRAFPQYEAAYIPSCSRYPTHIYRITFHVLWQWLVRCPSCEIQCGSIAGNSPYVCAFTWAKVVQKDKVIIYDNTLNFG